MKSAIQPNSVVLRSVPCAVLSRVIRYCETSANVIQPYPDIQALTDSEHPSSKLQEHLLKIASGKDLLPGVLCLKRSLGTEMCWSSY